LADCRKCGLVVYVGSRLPEDAYSEVGKDEYAHVTCPPERNVRPSSKATADGKCGMCNQSVPPDSLNKFYCSSACAREAYQINHPDEDDD
jgi:hypothetical protein